MDLDDDQFKEKIDQFKNDQSFNDEELNSFIQRVDKVEGILQKMRSPDEETVKLGMAQANEMLGKDMCDVDEDRADVIIKRDRCVINKNAYKEEPNKQTMEFEAFKRSVEVDANRRAEERRQKKEVAERFKMEGNKAFRAGNYNKALDSYNKALDEVRDSCVLYNNRALTLLKVGLPRRALQDTEKALHLNESSLKALLYKAQASHQLGNNEEAEASVKMAIDKHPQHKKYILEYTAQWYQEDNQNLNSF